ncbi:MAG: transposase family protein [Nitrospira sp.]
MITYTNLKKHPSAVSSLIGMSLPAFDPLFAEFEVAHQQRLAQSTLTRRTKQPRQRGLGAGRKHRYALRDRLLLTLFWLRVYMTYEVIGFFYGLNKTNIEDILHDCLRTLETMSTFVLELPSAERKKLRSVAAVMDAFPDVRLVVDAKEQRIQRPNNPKDEEGNVQDLQKPYYSGKKKAHTLKNEIDVAPDGRIEYISPSVPGGANHDLTLQRQTRSLARLDKDEAGMVDKGYDGVQNDYPDKRIYQPYKARRGHPLTEEQKEYNRHLARYRIVVEHTNAQLNRFEVLKQVYRHAREGHGRIVRVVAGLVNRQIAAKPLKTYAAA